MKAKYFITVMLLTVASVQTIWAQKVVLNKTDGSSIVCDVSELDCIRFVEPGGWLVTKIVLSESSIRLNPDEMKTLTANVYPEDADNKILKWESSNDAVAEVNKNGRVIANADGTCIITCSATDGSGVKAECLVTVGTAEVDYVTIGGLKWATKNLGATTVSGSYTTCFGDYYAWGETEPRYTTMSISQYGASFTWKSGFEDGYSESNWPSYTGNTLDAAHDAATAQLGGSWRTPTIEDYKALVAACVENSDQPTPVKLSGKVTSGGIYWLSSSQTYESEYTGVTGLLFVSSSDISKRVFFPASGNVRGTTLRSGLESARYMSASLYISPYNPSDNSNASCLYFTSSQVDLNWIDYRYRGLTVRPVSEKELTR